MGICTAFTGAGAGGRVGFGEGGGQGNLLTESKQVAYLAQHVVLHLHPLVVSQQVVVLACVLLPHGIRKRLAAEILACAARASTFNSVVLRKWSSMLHQPMDHTGMALNRPCRRDDMCPAGAKLVMACEEDWT